MIRLVPRATRLFSACGLGLISSLAGCGGGGGGDVGPRATPAAIGAVSGNGQTGEAGSLLAQPLVVRVTSSSGAPVEGTTVIFAVGAASGSVAAAQATTNADGNASTTWTLGTGVGTNSDTVVASVSGVTETVVFTATVTAAAAASLEAVSGNGQSGTAGRPLGQPLVVMARDQYGNPRSQVDVAWAVTSGGGSISPVTSTTGTDGRASAIWTVGGDGVNGAQAVATGLSGSPVSFGATVTPTSSRLAIVSGNDQSGAPSQSLVLPLVVSLEAAAGDPVPGIAVTWAVSTGGGSLSQTSTPTDGQGQASIIWTLGPALGQQSVSASVDGATGSPLTFTATAANPSSIVTLTSLTPNPIVEGQSATLTGTGFSTSRSENRVIIEGIDATVTAATATSLTIQVPAFNCQPARRVPVQVRVGGESSNVLSQDLNPGSFISVAVGQQLVLQDPQQYCLQFAPTASPEDYLIGVQSTSEVVASLTPARLTAVAAPGQPSAAPLPELARQLARSQRHTALTDSRLQGLKRRAAAEAELRAEERQQVYPLLSRAFRSRQRAVQGSAAIPPVFQPGDVIPIRYPGPGNACTSHTEVQAVVRVIGQHGIWLEDLENPAGGLTQDDIQLLSDELDDRIYITVTDFFGLPTDLDGNGRIAVLLTRRVNEIHPGVVGHVGLADLVPRSVCASSDEGEIYYGIVPDPTGAFGEPVTRQTVLSFAVQTIAHEFTHIIQFGQRFILNDLPPHPVWIIEGQAMLAEEITGHVYEGRAPGQNYGGDIALNLDDPASIDWYTQSFFGLFLYYGFRDPQSKVPNAPEECSWLAGKPQNPGPCIGGLEVYGPPWSLLRWISDLFGANFPTGEKGLHQALIRNPAAGYAGLAAVTGVPINTLLAQWAATLYVDDRLPGAAPTLQLRSWNLLDIENTVVESAHLVPRSRGFTSFADAFNVRAGSSAYFRISGAFRPGTAVRIRSASDQSLPSIMQVFVVRLQ